MHLKAELYGIASLWMLMLSVLLSAINPAAATAQSGRANTSSPYTLAKLRELIDIAPDEVVAGELTDRGISFALTDNTFKEISDRGTGPKTVALLKDWMRNHSLRISLKSEQETIEQGVLLNLRVDAGEQEFVCTWKTTLGVIKSSERSATLDTSDLKITSPTTIKVTVTAIDLKGSLADISKIITVLPAKPESPPEPTVEMVVDGKFLLVQIKSKPGQLTELTGSMDVDLFPSLALMGSGRATGYLPGVPCRVDLIVKENIADYSFKETPGAPNQWERMQIRIRPKNPRKVVSFSVAWIVLQRTSTAQDW